MRIALTVSSALVIGLGCARADAAIPCAKGASRVEVTIDGGSPDLARSLRDELDSELSRAKLCTAKASDDKPPLARIAIGLDADGNASVRIVDSVTKKTVERQVSVAGLPADGRALPIAIAADELLRASWAEITLQSDDDSQHPADVPKVVRESVEKPKPVPRKAFAAPNEIGLVLSTAAYGGGQTQLGGDLFYRRDFVSWLSGAIHVYGRDALVVHAADGTVHAQSFGGGLSLEANALRAGRVRLGPDVGVEVGYASFQGHPSTGAKGSKLESLTAFGSLGLGLTIDLSPIRLSAAALALAPFHGAAAIDGTKVVTSMAGAGFLGTLGVGVAF